MPSPLNPPVGTIVRQQSTQYINYIDLPLNLVLKFGQRTKFVIGGGPYGSFFYTGKETSQTEMNTGVVDSEENSDLSVGNQPGQYRTYNFGVNGLVGRGV